MMGELKNDLRNILRTDRSNSYHTQEALKKARNETTHPEVQQAIDAALVTISAQASVLGLVGLRLYAEPRLALASMGSVATGELTELNTPTNPV